MGGSFASTIGLFATALGRLCGRVTYGGGATGVMTVMEFLCPLAFVVYGDAGGGWRGPGVRLAFGIFGALCLYGQGWWVGGAVGGCVFLVNLALLVISVVLSGVFGRGAVAGETVRSFFCLPVTCDFIGTFYDGKG